MKGHSAPSGSIPLPFGRGLLLALTLAVAGIGPDHASADEAVRLAHALSVRLDPTSRELRAEDIVTNPPAGAVVFGLHRLLRVERALLDGAPVAVLEEPGSGGLTRWRIPAAPAGTARTLAITYRGALAALPEADHREVLGGLPPMASPQGSYLPAGAGWYPEFDGTPFTYRLRLDLPADQRGLAPGQLVSEEIQGGRYRAAFAFAHPAEGITLIAGPYRVRELPLPRDRGDPVRLRTYFSPEIDDLAGAYMSAVEGYVGWYSRWIGPYPYDEFSIVSSPLPTGFGLPTLTYLGVEVLRLPFIRTTSLGHEVLHNWWGNGVYVDWETGNWSEGLTTFMADYTYQEQAGPEAARDLRLSWLRDFAAVPPGQDAPLRQFTARTHGTSQVVGYGKSAFLFLMLRDRIGSEAFDLGLRRFWRDQQFRRAGWADLARAFEQGAGQDLSGFFAQWLSRRGAPRLRIEAAQVERVPSGYRVRLRLAQDAPAYALRVPVRLTTDAGDEDQRLDLATARQEFAIEVRARPRAATLDPEFRLFRRLAPGEAPPILRQVMLDPTSVTVVPTRDATVREAALDLAGRLLDRPPKAEGAEASPPDAPLLVIGLRGDVEPYLARVGLPPRPETLPPRGTAQVWTAYHGNGKAMTVVVGDSLEALRDAARPLPHYGRQSYLSFDGPRVLERGVWPSRNTAFRLPQVD